MRSVIKFLGDEKEASKIAKNIVRYRNEKKITNTTDLVKIIEKSKKKYSSKINPCTRTFQALRIFVNKEITELINGIISATKKLTGWKNFSRKFSFHRIELKYFFNNFSSNQSKPSRYVPEDIKEPVLFDDYKNNCLSHQKRKKIIGLDLQNLDLQQEVKIILFTQKTL